MARNAYTRITFREAWTGYLQVLPILDMKGLKNGSTLYGVYKAYSVEECLNKVNELDGKVDIVFVDGKIAADRSAMLIIKVKRINSNIKIMVLAEDETDKTRVLEYGADEFAAKPIGAETIVDKVYSVLLTREPK